VCFSSTASFTASAVLGGIGFATLPFVRDRREWLFAALPLGFAAHQLLEGAIWQQVEQSSEPSVRTGAVVAWLFYAWFLLPIWMPLAARALEPDRRRRRWMLGLTGLGVLTGTFLFVSSMILSAGVRVTRHHLEYQLPMHPGWLLAVPYLLATCLPLLLSTRVFVRRFGVAMVVALGASSAIAAKELSSVWCFFAALLSAGVFAHFALARREEQSVSLAS